MRRFVDLSIAIENEVKADPPSMRPVIEYRDHVTTIQEMIDYFPGLTAKELKGGEAWAMETVTLSTHNGTHVDAPWHYASTMDGGQRALFIDEMPLNWFFQPGVKLDLRHLSDGHVVTAADIEKELDRIGHTLSPLEIVMINTKAGARHGQDDFIHSGCGMGREATLYLTSKGVRVMGTDGWSWDAPFKYTAQRFSASRDPSIIWEGHKAGLEVGYSQIEKLTNLDQLPPSGFQVACFPCKIKSASGGWTRAVAIFDE
jgi:kynurenine formamidase